MYGYYESLLKDKNTDPDVRIWVEQAVKDVRREYACDRMSALEILEGERQARLAKS